MAEAPSPRGSWTRDYLNRAARSGELAQAIGVAPASAQAQRQGGGIGVENIRRGVGRAALTDAGGNITVSATSYTALSTPLVLEMWLSGRPLEVTLTGSYAAGASASLAIDVLLRGVSVMDPAATNGVASTSSTAAGSFFGYGLVMAPAPGAARLEVVAKRVTANGTIYVGGGNVLVLAAKEL